MRHSAMMLIWILVLCLLGTALPVLAAPLGARVMFQATGEGDGQTEPEVFDITISTPATINIEYIWNTQTMDWELKGVPETYSEIKLKNNDENLDVIASLSCAIGPLIKDNDEKALVTVLGFTDSYSSAYGASDNTSLTLPKNSGEGSTYMHVSFNEPDYAVGEQTADIEINITYSHPGADL